MIIAHTVDDAEVGKIILKMKINQLIWLVTMTPCMEHSFHATPQHQMENGPKNVIFSFCIFPGSDVHLSCWEQKSLIFADNFVINISLFKPGNWCQEIPVQQVKICMTKLFSQIFPTLDWRDHWLQWDPIQVTQNDYRKPREHICKKTYFKEQN